MWLSIMNIKQNETKGAINSIKNIKKGMVNLSGFDKVPTSRKIRKKDNDHQKKVLKAFNGQIIEFFDDLKNVLTTKKKYSILWMTLRAFIFIKPKEIILRWDYYINTGGLLKRPNRVQIKNHDNAFFSHIEYTKEEQDTFTKSSKMLMDIIEEIKTNISEVGDEDKSKIFQYLNNLCDLADVYFMDSDE